MTGPARANLSAIGVEYFGVSRSKDASDEAVEADATGSRGSDDKLDSALDPTVMLGMEVELATWRSVSADNVPLDRLAKSRS